MRSLLFVALLCLLKTSFGIRQVENLDNPKRISGEFLIVLRPSANQVTNSQYAKSVASKIVGISSKITILNSFTNLKTPILHVSTSDESVMDQLFQLDEVDIIDSDLYQNMIQACFSQFTRARLWHLSRINSQQLPDYTDAQYWYQGNHGNGVKVYILDTGIRLTHAEFIGRIEFGQNLIGGSDDDNEGHGTHCAGIAAGGQYGVSKGATLVAVKVLGDDGAGSISTIIAGINWMVGDVQAGGWRGVGSMSLGGMANSAMDAAVNSADDAGVPVVVAAGNSNSDACNSSPARASGSIAVASTDNDDVLSSFSSWGSCVYILAPGRDILSAAIGHDSDETILSGTSMACPHVAGYIANYLADNPGATTVQVKQYLTNTATLGAINLRGTTGTPNTFLHSTCVD